MLSNCKIQINLEDSWTSINRLSSQDLPWYIYLLAWFLFVKFLVIRFFVVIFHNLSWWTYILFCIFTPSVSTNMKIHFYEMWYNCQFLDMLLNKFCYEFIHFTILHTLVQGLLNVDFNLTSHHRSSTARLKTYISLKQLQFETNWSLKVV
mgnify:CR=1 FL=1